MGLPGADRSPEGVRRRRGRRGLRPVGRARRVRVVPRAVRLRQDDDAAHDRGLRAARLPGPITVDGKDITQHAAEQAQRGHGLPVVRPVPEHDRRRQHRLRDAGPEAPEGRDPQAGRRAAGDDQPAREGAIATRTSSRAGSSSASRSRARSRSSRRCSCSTSRCRRSTPRSAIALRSEIRAIQRQLGITTVYVTHDQEEALSLSDRVVVMSEGRIEQIGTPFEIYNYPATRVRGLVRRHAQPGRGRRSSTHRRGACRSAARRSGPRSPSRMRGAGDHVTLAVRPEGIDAGRGPGRLGTGSRGRLQDISFLGIGRPLPSRARRVVRRRRPVRPGARHVQRSAPEPPDRRRHRDRWRSRRRRASSSPTAGEPPAHGPGGRGGRRGVTRPPRRHRPGHLRQGRHAHRVPRDVERLGRRAGRRPGTRDRPADPRTPVRDARL